MLQSKRQGNFVLSELRKRVSDKLGPAVRKQKINTFKLLKVMHKYLSAIHAGSTRERLRVQIPLVYTFHVFLLLLLSRNHLRKGTECLCFPPEGGDSHMKQTGKLVVSLRGVNFGFWSRLGCFGQPPIFYAAKVSFRVPRRNTEFSEEKQKSNFLLNFLFR